MFQKFGKDVILGARYSSLLRRLSFLTDGATGRQGGGEGGCHPPLKLKYFEKVLYNNIVSVNLHLMWAF